MPENLTSVLDRITTLPEIYAPSTEGYLGKELRLGHAIRRGYTDASVAAADSLWRSPSLDRRLVELFDGTETIGRVRESLPVRAHAVELLWHKLQELAAKGELPERIQQNDKKAPPIAGYPYETSSREYAVILALSMLDGTFHGPLNPVGNEIEYDEYGRAKVGQHRAAAMQLLQESLEAQEVINV